MEQKVVCRRCLDRSSGVATSRGGRQPPEGRGGFQRECSLADSCLSGMNSLQDCEGENIFLLFQATVFVMTCCDGHKKN